LITADAVRTVHENTLVWTLVGTDGLSKNFFNFLITKNFK